MKGRCRIRIISAHTTNEGRGRVPEWKVWDNGGGGRQRAYIEGSRWCMRGSCTWVYMRGVIPLLDLGQRSSDTQRMVPKTTYRSHRSPSSTTTLTSIASTNYYRSLPTSTNQSLTTPAVDLAITAPQQTEPVTGLPSIWKGGYKNPDGMGGTSAVDPLVDVWDNWLIIVLTLLVIAFTIVKLLAIEFEMAKSPLQRSALEKDVELT